MKKYWILIGIISGLIIAMGSCKKVNTENDATPPSTVSELSAGNETIFDESASAFGDDFPSISPTLEHIHDYGEVIFNEIFTPPPGYAYSYYTGLGPIFNNNSCNACHAGVGEGNPPPGGGTDLTSMLFRVSVGNSVSSGPIDAPGFGGQLQNNAVQGIMPEGTVNITYTDVNLTFADGTPYQLQIPNYQLVQTYTTVPAGMMLSPRVAPRLIGLGFLEIIPVSTILASVNNSLQTGDTSQINGKPNYVWDYTTQSMQLGRFGWKAEQPTIKQQLAAAYQQDMGVTNSVFPQESSYGQSQYNTYAGDPSPELPDSELYDNVIYIQTLAVPAERNSSDPQVVRGAQIFNSAGAQCASCHTPTITTPQVFTFPDPQPYPVPQLGNVVIHPYSDMLLHDMGAGLADNRPSFSATGRQWRTPPLWGIGLVPTVCPSGQFLHDGRARTLMEAIMWHGGEAYKAKEYVRNLSASDRAALIAFLQSL